MLNFLIFLKLQITILPQGDSLGHTMFLSKELNLYTEEQLMDLLVVAMGGRVSEDMTFGKVTTGAVHDLQRVTKIAYELVHDVFKIFLYLLKPHVFLGYEVWDECEIGTCQF